VSMAVWRRAVLLVALACMSVLAVTSVAQAGSTIIQREMPFQNGYFSNPEGVAVDQPSGDVYVASLLFSAAVKVDSSGALLNAFDRGRILSGAAVNPVNGNVYIVNAQAHTIETYSSSGGFLSEFSVEGSQNFFGAYTAVQIASDSAGNVYVPFAPSNEVRELGPSGNQLQTFTGTGSSALSGPAGVAVDSSGDVYVADTGNGRLEKFSPAGAFIMAIGTGVDQTTGGNLCTAASGDTCGPASDGVKALALDSVGNIYAGENGGSGYHVVMYDAAGSQLADVGLGSIGSSSYEGAGATNTLAVKNADGLVYVSDGGNNEVWIYGPPVAPTVEGESFSGVTQTKAGLHATVDPQGQDTHYYVEHEISALGACPSSPGQTGTDMASLYGAQSASEEASGLQAATVYHYRVVAYNATGVSCGEERSFTTLPLAPAITTGAVTGVGANGATLNGTVNPNGNGNWTARYEFQYGLSTSYTVSTLGDAGSASSPVPASATLEDLLPNRTYHYRLVATNAGGTTIGQDQTFTTSTLSPTVTTGAAERTNDSSALIGGTVNPQGLSTTFVVQYGTGTSYGSLAPTEPAGVGSSFADEPLSVQLNGLQPATVYHYRLIATNAAGTSYGQDNTLMTTGAAVMTTPFGGYAVPSVPPVSAEAVAFPQESKGRNVKSKKRSGNRRKPRHKKSRHGKKR
jgi:NHL repeat